VSTFLIPTKNMSFWFNVNIIPLQRYPKDYTLGVFVVSTGDGYSNPALLHARSSPYKLLLTDIHNLRDDLSNYSLRGNVTEDIFEQILRKLKNIEKRDKKKVNKMNKKLIRLNRRVKKRDEQDWNRNNNRDIFYFLLGAIASCIIFLFLIFRNSKFHFFYAL